MKRDKGPKGRKGMKGEKRGGARQKRAKALRVREKGTENGVVVHY